MKPRVFGFLLLLLTATAWAGDVSGVWTGGLVLDTGKTVTAYVRLKQERGVVSGTQGPSEDHQFPITRGRIDGEQVVIEAKPGPAVLRLAMKLEGNKLLGDVFEDERKIGTVSLQKTNP